MSILTLGFMIIGTNKTMTGVGSIGDRPNNYPAELH